LAFALPATEVAEVQSALTWPGLKIVSADKWDISCLIRVLFPAAASVRYGCFFLNVGFSAERLCNMGDLRSGERIVAQLKTVHIFQTAN